MENNSTGLRKRKKKWVWNLNRMNIITVLSTEQKANLRTEFSPKMSSEM